MENIAHVEKLKYEKIKKEHKDNFKTMEDMDLEVLRLNKEIKVNKVKQEDKITNLEIKVEKVSEYTNKAQ
jgi:hypothetical protein